MLVVGGEKGKRVEGRGGGLAPPWEYIPTVSKNRYISRAIINRGSREREGLPPESDETRLKESYINRCKTTGCTQRSKRVVAHSIRFY